MTGAGFVSTCRTKMLCVLRDAEHFDLTSAAQRAIIASKKMDVKGSERMEPIYEQRAQVFKALCDPRRQKILALLQGGEKCACKLIEEMGMPQSSLSYHMKVLCASGIVVGREEGKWTHYRIDPAGSRRAVELLQAITTSSCDTDNNSCCCAHL